MKITRTELRQIIREELNKELQQEGVLDTVKGFFGYGDKEKEISFDELKKSFDEFKGAENKDKRKKREQFLANVVRARKSSDENTKQYLQDLEKKYPSLLKKAQHRVLTKDYKNEFTKKVFKGEQGLDKLGRDLNFHGRNFRKSEFKNINLEGVIFSNCDLSGASFYNANLENCKFENCNLTNLDIYRGNMDGAKILDCQTENIRLKPDSANKALFSKVDFSADGFSLFKYNNPSTQVKFEKCNFGLSFGGIYNKCYFLNCTFKGAFFSDARFTETTFGRTKFLGCTFDSSETFGQGNSFSEIDARGSRFESVIGKKGKPIYLNPRASKPCPANLDPRVDCVEKYGNVMIVDSGRR